MPSKNPLYPWLCAKFGAVIIVDFYIDDFIFALYIFMKDGKAVNYNGSEIIGLINLKYGKRTACRNNFLPWMRYFPEKQGKGQQRGRNLNLLNCGIFLKIWEKVYWLGSVLNEKNNRNIKNWSKKNFFSKCWVAFELYSHSASVSSDPEVFPTVTYEVIS